MKRAWFFVCLCSFFLNVLAQNRKPFLFCLKGTSLINRETNIDRNVIEIVRIPSSDELEACVQFDDQTSLWTEEHELMVQFTHGPEIAIVPLDENDIYEFHDVYVNRRFTHTCAFRADFDATETGVLCTIIRDQGHIRIAESPDSRCIPAHELYKRKGTFTRFAPAKPLRNQVLKTNAERATK